MHVLTAEQFSTEEIAKILDQADEFRKILQTKQGKQRLVQKHQGEQICSLFYEPSTRTRNSFEAAALKLGMDVVSTESAEQFSSAAKGETIEDTIQVLNGYGFAVIVMRTKEKGMAARAAKVSKPAIINAGDGQGEHPTQALLDAYTIKKELGRLKDLKIVMGGDLKHGRTVRSLAQMLAKYPDNQITFVSVPELQIDEDIKTILDNNGTTYSETADMYDALGSADVVYWTRLQKERLENPNVLPSSGFVLDNLALKAMNKNAIILHPLPRVDEVHPDVDGDPRAKYFQQAENGLYIRMALLDRATTR